MQVKTFETLRTLVSNLLSEVQGGKAYIQEPVSTETEHALIEASNAAWNERWGNRAAVRRAINAGVTRGASVL